MTPPNLYPQVAARCKPCASLASRIVAARNFWRDVAQYQGNIEPCNHLASSNIQIWALQYVCKTIASSQSCDWHASILQGSTIKVEPCKMVARLTLQGNHKFARRLQACKLVIDLQAYPCKHLARFNIQSWALQDGCKVNLARQSQVCKMVATIL